MAKEKDSFIMYTSYIATFEKLSDNEAGKLIKHILRYVNDLNPSLDDNRLLEIVFEGIKQDLKRDLLKWEKKCEINRKNAKKGGAPVGNVNAKKTTKTTETTERLKKQPKQPDYDNDGDSDMNNIRSSKLLLREGDPHADIIDFKKLVDFFNSETGGVFGTVRYPISDSRKRLVNARIKEHGKDRFVEVVRKAVASDFLKGQSNRGFVASFDWIIKPTNFEKILSGNYGNKENSEPHSGKRPTTEEISAAVEIGIGLAKASSR